MKNIIECHHCKARFGYRNCHAGFADEIFYYCDTCGMVAVIDRGSGEMRHRKFYERFGLNRPDEEYPGNKEEKIALIDRRFREMQAAIAKSLLPCACGGNFTMQAIPRCPHCKKELDWNKVVDQIDATSGSFKPHYYRDDVKHGWHDIYYFVFDNKLVRENWERYHV